MTETGVVLHLLSSFLLAGAWIGMATVLAERLGSRLGGLVANLPSNIVISYIFIAWGRDVVYAAQATAAVPVGMLIDTVFLGSFMMLLNRGVLAAVSGSLLVWMVLAWMAASFGPVPMSVSIPAYLVAAVSVWALLERFGRIRAHEPVRTRPRFWTVCVRMAFAGSVVSGTVALSYVLPPYWVGLFSTFPAVLLSSMVILAVVRGRDFARATGKVLILSSTNIVAYAVGVRFGYPAWGIMVGTAAAFTASVAWILMLRPLVTGQPFSVGSNES